MRICFISNPNNTHTRRWVSWFAIRGHQVLLIADVHPVKPWNEIDIIDLSTKIKIPGVKYLPWGLHTRQAIDKFRPEIIHAHRLTGAGWVAALAGRHPLVLTSWGSDIYLFPNRSWLHRQLTRHTTRQADLITVDSADLSKEIRKYTRSDQRVEIIQWGVDLKSFYPSTTRSSIADQLNIVDGPVILSARSAAPVYNIDVIIQAFALILQIYPNAILVLRELNVDNNYLRYLKTLIVQLGLTRSIRWVGDLDDISQRVDLYRLADLVISVSSSDSTPVTILEAMACGTSVIASDLPSLREWITHEQNGLLVPARNISALAEAMENYFEHPEAIRAQFLSNMKMIEDRADHDAEMTKMEILYNQLVSERVCK